MSNQEEYTNKVLNQIKSYPEGEENSEVIDDKKRRGNMIMLALLSIFAGILIFTLFYINSNN